MRRAIGTVDLSSGVLSCCWGQQRRRVAFSEAHPLLAFAAQHRGFVSNVWVFPCDFLKIVFDDRVVAGPPTQLSVTKRVALVNRDQLFFPIARDEPAAHTNGRTGVAFIASVAASLDSFAKRQGFRSRLWFPSGGFSVTSWRGQATRGSTYVHSFSQDRACFNMDQVANDCGEIRNAVFSALTGTPYSSSVRDQLRQHMQAHGFDVPLYVAESLTSAGWPLQHGAQPVLVTCRPPLRNLADLVGGDDLAAAHNRPAGAPVPMFFETGCALEGEQLQWVTRNGPWPSNYWLTNAEAAYHGLEPKPGVARNAWRSQAPFRLFNVAQLDVPAADVLAAVGSMHTRSI